MALTLNEHKLPFSIPKSVFYERIAGEAVIAALSSRKCLHYIIRAFLIIETPFILQD